MWPSPKIVLKPTYQSHSKSISGAFLQIFVGGSFIFDQLSQLRVVHLRKNVNFYFKKLLTIFIFFLFIEHPKPNNLTISDFIEKFPKSKKKFFFFCPKCNTDHRKKFNLKFNWDHKLLIMERYIEISPVVLELWPKKQANELSVFVAMLLN